MAQRVQGTAKPGKSARGTVRDKEVQRSFTQAQRGSNASSRRAQKR